MNYSEERIREIFFEEMREIVERIDQDVLLLEANPNDGESVRRLFREVHTLKGSSGVFGLREIVDLTHHAEDLLEKLRDGLVLPGAPIVSALLRCFTRAKEMMVCAREGRPLADFDNKDIIALLRKLRNGEVPEEVCVASVEPPRHSSVLASAQEPRALAEYEISLEACDAFFLVGIDPTTLVLNCRDLARGDFRLETSTVRVPRLSELDPEKCMLEFRMGFSSESTEAEIRELLEFASSASRMELTRRFPAAPAPSLSPVEGAAVPHPGREQLERFMTLVGDMASTNHLFSFLSERIQAELPGIAIARQLREGLAGVGHLAELMRGSVAAARSVPVGSMHPKWERVVRDVSKRLGKSVNLVVETEVSEIDQGVADVISDPILHLLRNAIDHGIELPHDRLARGKSETGTLVIRFSLLENEVEISLSDDGNGLDFFRIREKAESLGLATAEEGARMSREDVFEFIFHPGFSTAPRITDVSGRGVGMDVVREGLRKVGGSVAMTSRDGEGTTFRLRLPRELMLADALFVRCGGAIYALPHGAVLDFVSVRADEVVTGGTLPVHGETLSVVSLSSCIPVRSLVLHAVHAQVSSCSEVAAASCSGGDKSAAVVVVRCGGAKVGLQVDALCSRERAVVHSLGWFLAGNPVCRGACVLEGGRIAPLLDPQELLKRTSPS